MENFCLVELKRIENRGSEKSVGLLKFGWFGCEEIVSKEI